MEPHRTASNRSASSATAISARPYKDGTRRRPREDSPSSPGAPACRGLSMPTLRIMSVQGCPAMANLCAAIPNRPARNTKPRLESGVSSRGYRLLSERRCMRSDGPPHRKRAGESSITCPPYQGQSRREPERFINSRSCLAIVAFGVPGFRSRSARSALIVVTHNLAWPCEWSIGDEIGKRIGRMSGTEQPVPNACAIREAIRGGPGTGPRCDGLLGRRFRGAGRRSGSRISNRVRLGPGPSTGAGLRLNGSGRPPVGRFPTVGIPPSPDSRSCRQIRLVADPGDRCS